MKKLFLTILALTCIVGAKAQNGDFNIENAAITSSQPVVFGFGPKIGANYAMLGGDGADTRKGMLGFTGGGTIDAQFSRHFSVSLDILYSTQGYEMKDAQERLRMSYIVTPVMLNYLVSHRFALKVGLQPTFLMDAVYTTDGDRESVKKNYKGFDIGIPIAVGYMLMPNLELEAKYNYGLMNVSNVEDLKLNNSVFTLTVGYKF